jgi:hypothetical protein
MIESDERSLSAFKRLGGLACRAVALAMLPALSGCQAPAAPFDPFMAGRTTIPPPGTAAPAIAAQTTAAPYYDTAPPVVTVPGASTIYPPPGVITAPVPNSALPPAGSGRFPRGITLPQASAAKPADAAKLAGWQPAGLSDSNAVRDSAAAASSEDRGTTKSTSDVVRASHHEPGREPPIRIVPPQQKQ